MKRKFVTGGGRKLRSKFTGRKPVVRNRRRDSFFVKTILFLGAGFLLLALVTVAGFNRLNDVIFQKDDEVARNTLYQVEQAGTQMIDELLLLSESMAGNESLAAFSVGDRSVQDSIISNFADTVRQHPLVYNVYLISPKLSVCLTAKGEENLSGITAMLTQRSREMIKNPESFESQFRFLRLYADDKLPGTSSLTFAHPIVDANAQRVGVLVYVLERSAVNTRIGAYIVPSRFDLCWLDASDELLYSSGVTADKLVLRYKSLVDNTAQEIKDISKRPVISYSVKNKKAGIAYTLLQTQQPTKGWVLYLPPVIVMFLVVTAILIFLYSYVRHQTRAISNSLALLSEHGIINMESDEEETLDNLIVKLVAERETLNLKLSNYKAIDLDNRLSRLLAGETTVYDEFFLPHPYYAVCMIHMDNQSVFRRDVSISVTQEKMLIKLVVDNVLNEKYVCYSRFAGRRLICLFNVAQTPNSTATQEVSKELETLRHVCEKELELIFVCGVSDVSEIRTDISKLNRQSAQALEYALVKSLPIVTYPEIHRKLRTPESETNYFKRLIEKEHIVVKSCQHWSHTNVKLAMDDFLKLLIEDVDNSFDVVSGKCKEIFRAIINTLRQNHMAEVYSVENEEEDYRELTLCHTGRQLMVFFELFLSRLDSYVSGSRAKEQDYFIAKVESILEQKFDDVSLSVSMIADELGMPVRQVSSQYKAKTGYGLLDRIHIYRIESAKRWLTQTQDSVYEIAERCGYENVNTFIRVFRRYTGTTPGRFRNIQ